MMKKPPAIIVVVFFFALAGGSALLNKLSPLVPVAYAVISFITFVAYAIDKSAAKNRRWRTSERTLHLLALVGGWPGALLAQATLRHKSKKVSFRVVFWATVLINCAALTWFHTADGRRTLTSTVLPIVGYDTSAFGPNGVNLPELDLRAGSPGQYRIEINRVQALARMAD